MPTFVEIEPDPFATSFRSRAVGDPNEDGSAPGSGRAKLRRSFDHVRRPVRGIQIKDDTYATIQVYTADGRNIPLVDAGGDFFDVDNPARSYTNKYSNFLLQSVIEQRAEKLQIIQTFGAPFVWFFGQQPRIIQCNGVLMNTEDFNWRAEFWENYEKYLRGTKCVESNSRVTLSWDDIVTEGYFIEADAQEQANNPHQVVLNFKVLLTNYYNISRIGDSEFPRTSASEIDLDPYTMDTTGEGIGNLVSDTRTVRQLNTADFKFKNSLLQSLREGITTVLLDGNLSSLVEVADSFIYGRNIRVPLGAAGGSVYDQETQIALASAAPEDRYIILRGALGDQNFTIKAPMSLRRTYGAGVARFATIQDNVDEYIARAKSSTGAPINPPDLFHDQKIKDSLVSTKVKEVFEQFGVDTDPPSEAVLLARRAGFGFMAVLVGSAVSSEGFSSLRQASNVLL
jgi:hypothetical protein